MQLPTFWKWPARLMFPPASSDPGKSSPSSRKASYHGTSSGTLSCSNLSRNSDFVPKRKSESESESLEAVKVCTTNSTTATEVFASRNDGVKASPPSTIVSSSFASSSAGNNATNSREHAQTGEITEEVESTVPPGVVDELEQVFENFDINKDGKISPAELKDVLEALGDNATEEEAIQMLKDVDTDGDGYIDLENFISISTTPEASRAGAGRSEELRAAFDVFDVNNEGFITAEKLGQVLNKLMHSRHTIEECQKMIRGVDLDGDGKVNFEDFKNMMA